MRAPTAPAAAAAPLLLLLLLAAAPPRAVAKTVPATTTTLDTRACQAPHDTLGFCNVSAPLAARAAALTALLRDDEILPQLTARHGGGGSPGPASNVSRLGLPEFDWGLNAIHGVQSSCVGLADGSIVCPVSFPNPGERG